jgi:hypothetical protein
VRYRRGRRQLSQAAADILHRNGFGDADPEGIAAGAGTHRVSSNNCRSGRREPSVEVTRESLPSRGDRE